MIKAIAPLLILGVFLGIAVWWKTYEYSDCRHVGHSRLYCTVNIF